LFINISVFGFFSLIFFSKQFDAENILLVVYRIRQLNYIFYRIPMYTQWSCWTESGVVLYIYIGTFVYIYIYRYMIYYPVVLYKKNTALSIYHRYRPRRHGALVRRSYFFLDFSDCAKTRRPAHAMTA
jgi:hypothetical protein